MNNAVLVLDFVLALVFSAQGYDISIAYIYGGDPRWTAEQTQANRRTAQACGVMMGLAALSGLAIIPVAVLTGPFWEGPWWAIPDVVFSLVLALLLPITRGALRRIKTQRYRLIS